MTTLDDLREACDSMPRREYAIVAWYVGTDAAADLFTNTPSVLKTGGRALVAGIPIIVDPTLPPKAIIEERRGPKGRELVPLVGGGG